MTSPSVTTAETRPATVVHTRLVFTVLAGLLVLAPLFRSGQPPLALASVQLLGLAILLGVLWSRSRAGRLAGAEVVALALMAAFPLLYLVPLPSEWVASLPGRAPYIDAMALAGGVPEWLPLSLYPQETLGAWLFLLPAIAVYVGVRTVAPDQLVRLVVLVLLMAGAQVILGLIQFGTGRAGPFYLGMEYTHFDSAVGTYTNRNHLAGLIEMTLPIALAFYIFAFGRNGGLGRSGWHQRVSFFATLRGRQAFWYGALVVLLLVGVIFSRSRTGIALVILGVLVTTVLFSRRIGGDNMFGSQGTVVAIALAIGVAIGLAPVLERFSAQDPMDDARWTNFAYTLDGIGEFFPLGSGPGTFPDVFPAFQPLELGRWFVNHVHNDYLEWLFDGGVLAAVLLVFLLALYVRQWARLLSGAEWSRYRFLQVGAGIGLLLLLLHELVDYNLMMPANAVYFAFFAGIFMRDFSDAERPRKRRKHRTMRMEIKRDEVPAVRPSMAPPQTPVKNPFMD